VYGCVASKVWRLFQILRLLELKPRNPGAFIRDPAFIIPTKSTLQMLQHTILSKKTHEYFNQLAQNSL